MPLVASDSQHKHNLLGLQAQLMSARRFAQTIEACRPDDVHTYGVTEDLDRVLRLVDLALEKYADVRVAELHEYERD